jgi:hypothetical protein
VVDDLSPRERNHHPTVPSEQAEQLCVVWIVYNYSVVRRIPIEASKLENEAFSSKYADVGQ